jgi:hypothetical protein
MEIEIVSILVGFVSPFLVEAIKWLGKKITNELIKDRLAFILTGLVSLIIAVVSLAIDGAMVITWQDILTNWALIFSSGQLVFKMLNGTKYLPRAN